MATTVTIKGLDKLAFALRELPKKVALKRLRYPVMKASQLVRDDARIRAPIYEGPVRPNMPPPGTLKKSIIIKRVGAGTSQIARYIVTVRHGKKFQKFGPKGANVDAYYWRFPEFGTSKMAATPYMRPAFEYEKEAGLEMIVNGLAQGVEEEAKILAWGTPP